MNGTIVHGHQNIIQATNKPIPYACDSATTAYPGCRIVRSNIIAMNDTLHIPTSMANVLLEENTKEEECTLNCRPRWRQFHVYRYAPEPIRRNEMK